MRVIPDLNSKCLERLRQVTRDSSVSQYWRQDNYAIYENGSFWYGGIVPSSLQFRKNFEDEIYFLRGGEL